MKLPALRSRRPVGAEGEASRRPAPWGRLVRFPQSDELRAMLRKDPGLKLISLLLACFLWYSITKTERDAERNIEVPVSLRNIPDNMSVITPPTKPVSVTLRGPRTILDNVDERKSRIQLGLKRIEPGDNRVDFSGSMLVPELPRSLKVVRFDPPSFVLRADRRTMRRVPVKANLSGSLPLGYTVAESTVVPEVVEVTGPAKVVEGLKDVMTEAIDLTGVHDNMQRTVLLDRSDPSLTLVPDGVRVNVTVDETIVARELSKVPVTVPESVTQVIPATIDVTLRGPQRLLHNFKLDEGSVTVDASGLGPGTHTVPVQVKVPDGLKLAATTPDHVRVRIGGKRS